MPLAIARRRVLVTCLVIVLLGLAAASPGRGASPAPRAATTCDVKRDGRKLGATYVTSLKTTQVSCAKGKQVVRAFNACRKRHGGADGRCPSRVQGFSCSERRGAAIPTQYSAKVTCKSGARQVRFAYTQFT